MRPRATDSDPCARRGGIVLFFLPILGVELSRDERRFLSPGVVDDRAKNISLERETR